METEVANGRVSAAPSDRSPSPPPSPPVARGWGLPLAVLIVGMFMSILDISIVNVAMSAMRKDFGAATESVQWISTVYSLTEGIVVPASAWLGARYGLKRVYIWSLVLFTVASALCAMAGSLGALIFFRVVQAIPGGIIPVTCQTILYRIVPKEKLGTAMGLYGVGVVVAPAIGPALGGFLIEYIGWRAIFYINVPVGIAGAIAAMVLLTKFPAERNRPFDLAGFVCIAGALFALLLALEEGSSWGWTSYPVLLLFAAAINLLILFVVVELQVKHPILDVRVFKNWPFVNSLLLISSMMLGLYAVMFYTPMFLQNLQGLGALDAGLVLLPQGVVMAVLMPIAGRLYDRFGARWLAIIGLTLTGCGILMLSSVTVHTPRENLILGTAVMATGLGLGMMPIMTGGLSSVPSAFSDVGSAVNTALCVDRQRPGRRRPDRDQRPRDRKRHRLVDRRGLDGAGQPGGRPDPARGQRRPAQAHRPVAGYRRHRGQHRGRGPVRDRGDHLGDRLRPEVDLHHRTSGG
jgi:EmrB/QacA subfamily drug resistance transporter